MTATFTSICSRYVGFYSTLIALRYMGSFPNAGEGCSVIGTSRDSGGDFVIAAPFPSETCLIDSRVKSVVFGVR